MDNNCSLELLEPSGATETDQHPYGVGICPMYELRNNSGTARTDGAGLGEFSPPRTASPHSQSLSQLLRIFTTPQMVWKTPVFSQAFRRR